MVSTGSRRQQMPTLRYSRTSMQSLPYMLQHQGHCIVLGIIPLLFSQRWINILLFHASFERSVRSSPRFWGKLFKSTSVWSWTGSSSSIPLSPSSFDSFSSWFEGQHRQSVATHHYKRHLDKGIGLGRRTDHVRSNKTFHPPETWKLHITCGGMLKREGFSTLSSIYISRLLPGGVTTANVISILSWSVNLSVMLYTPSGQGIYTSVPNVCYVSYN